MNSSSTGIDLLKNTVRLERIFGTDIRSGPWTNCRGTARRAVPIEILLTDAQVYETSHLKRLTIFERPSSALKVIAINT